MPAASPRDRNREILRYAVAGTFVVLVAVWIDLQGRGNGNPVSLLDPGADGPSAEVIEADFPELRLPGGLGHDGQQFYAIARDPLPVDASAPFLDRPRYRLQRPLLPYLAALLHPQGGGSGLVLAMLAVSVAGVLVGGVAFGHLVVAAGGPTWAAGLFALLPGVYASLRISTADALALGLGLAAVAAAFRGRSALGAALGIAAVLAKEPTFLLLATVAVARRDRPTITVAGAAAFVAGAWALYLRATVTASGDQVVELVAPFTGWADAIDRWSDGAELIGAASCIAAVAAGALALVRRWGGTWTIPIVGHLAFTAVLGPSVLAPDYNGSRTTMPLLAIALIALLSPGRPAFSPDAR